MKKSRVSLPMTSTYLELKFLILSISLFSEAKVVIQIVDESQERMLHRSLVYTGYTRTRQTNFIIGQKNALNTALQNTSDLNRFSLIKERL